MNIFYNIVEDTESIYGDYFLILSSHKLYVQKINVERLENTLIYKSGSLEKINENYYSFYKDVLDDVTNMVKEQYFIESKLLSDFYDNSEETKNDDIEINNTESCIIENTKEEESKKLLTKVYNYGDEINIKNWKDLINSEFIYSYLQNYKKIMNEYDPLIFSAAILFKNKDFFNSLKDEDIATENYIKIMSKFYPLNLSSKGHKHVDGIFNLPSDTVLLTNPHLFNEIEPEREAIKIYDLNKEIYDNLYFYWLSIYANKNINNKKALMLGTIENIKNFDITKVDELFNFELLEVKDEIKTLKLNYEMKLIDKKETSVSIEENPITKSLGSFIWAFIEDCNFENIGKVKIKTKSNTILILENEEYFNLNNKLQDNCIVDNNIINYLKIRGLDISKSPNFNIPNYIVGNKENIEMLLSGIKNLSYSSKLFNYLNDIEDLGCEKNPDLNLEEILDSKEIDIDDEINDVGKTKEEVSEIENIEEDEDYDERIEEEVVNKEINGNISLIQKNSIKSDKLSKDEFIKLLYENLEPENLEMKEDKYLTEKIFRDILDENLMFEEIDTLKKAFISDILKDYNINSVYFSEKEFSPFDVYFENLKCLGLNKTEKDIYYLNVLVESKFSDAIVTIYIKDGEIQTYLPIYGNIMNSNNFSMLRDDEEDQTFLKIYGYKLDDIKDFIINDNKIEKGLNETFY